jgi:hypothetical protein
LGYSANEEEGILKLRVKEDLINTYIYWQEKRIRGLAIKSCRLFLPSHLNDDLTKQEYAPTSMALLVRRDCSRGQ